MDIKALEKAGFKHDDELKSAHEEQADKNSMHETGPYVVHGVWRKGLVSVLFEQNTAAEEMGGGMKAVIQHPAVCVVSGPKGRAACNPDDTELLLLLVEELA
jgi:hypothetical protein